MRTESTATTGQNTAKESRELRRSGPVLLIALGYIATNLLVDLVYGLLDPRIRYR